jgi:hypothetical protein
VGFPFAQSKPLRQRGVGSARVQGLPAVPVGLLAGVPQANKEVRAMWRNGFHLPWKRVFGAFTGVLLAVGASRGDDLADIKARMDALEKKNQELQQQLKQSQANQNYLPDTGAGAISTQAPEGNPDGGGGGGKPLDEKAVNGIVEKYLKDHPGSGMPSGVQVGFDNGFVIRSNASPSYDNWKDDSRIPFELQIHGRMQNDYFGYKVTDKVNHFTNFDTGKNTVGDESAILIKRMRFILQGTAFDPDLHFNITLDGTTRGLTGSDPRQNSFANPIGNVEGGQGVDSVDHAVRLFECWLAYDLHPCWSEKGCGCDCPDGTVPYQPTYRLIFGKQKPMFAFEEFVGGSKLYGLGGSAREQFSEYSMAGWFFDADDDNLLMAAGLQIFELEDRLFASFLVTNGNETQTPYLLLDDKPGLNAGFWYDFGGDWDEKNKRWLLYGYGPSDLDYHCNPVLRVGATSNLVPMDRRSIFTQAELDRARTIPPTPNGGGTVTSVLNGGGVAPAVAGVAGTSGFAVDAFDSYTYEAYAAGKWRGFSLLSDWWLRNLDNFRGEKSGLANNSNRPILYNVNNVGSNALNQVALFNRGGFIDYGTLLQAGYFVIPKKLELVARYSWIRGQSGDIRGDGTFRNLTTAERNFFGIPSAAAGGPATVRLYNNAFREYQEASEIAFGVNYYFKGHNLKWQSDISFYNGGNPAAGGQSPSGFIPGVDGYLIRSQIQLAF